MKIRGFFPLKWFGIRGIVLYPFILYAPKNPDQELEQHEHIHWQQVKVCGPMKFYLTYLREYGEGRRRGLSHDEAYRQISFEREAYTHQHQTNYLVSRETTAKYRTLT